jgi:hypothetical protein
MLRRHFGDKPLENLRFTALRLHYGLFLTALVVTSAGCGNILGIDDIEYQEPPPVDSCWDPNGLQGLGCFRTDGDCKLTKEQIPNACTDSPCMQFDNKERLGLSLPNDLPDVLDDIPIMFGSPETSALPACPPSTTAAPTVVVVGSNAIFDVVEYVSAELSRSGNPVTVLYQSQSSCNGAAAVLDNRPVAGEFLFWTYVNNTPTENKCALSEQQADIGISDVFATTCGLDTTSIGATDTLGPIQAMTFVAPKASSQKAISAEAARLVYGYEGTYPSGPFTAEPWTKPAYIQKRIASSGTQNLIGKFIGVSSASFKGHQNTTTADMIAALTDPGLADPNATIGILDVVNGDKNSTKIRVLAFQAEGQFCAFQPDAMEGSLDRRNVRDGHYVLWGPLHIFNRSDVSTTAGNVIKFLSLAAAPQLSGQTEAESMSALIGVTARGSLVPACAMQVQRASEGGPLSSLIPQDTCGCRYEAEVGVAVTCTPCVTEADCQSPDAPKCNFGFCEQQ